MFICISSIFSFRKLDPLYDYKNNNDNIHLIEIYIIVHQQEIFLQHLRDILEHMLQLLSPKL